MKVKWDAFAVPFHLLLLFLSPSTLPLVLKKLAALYLLLWVSSFATAQSTIDGPYHINGNASKENCNCYTLTPNQGNQSGSVWNVNRIDLNESFDYKFEVFLGCNDAGADGMAFVLQPISTIVGSSGGGIGFQGIDPSVGVVIDTWQNSIDNDPDYDHISINRNGDIMHQTTNNLAGPVTALPNSGNIEDCQFHALRVQWDALTQTLTASMDGEMRVSATIDMINTVFSGNPEVFWGFSSATGGAWNQQRFCTSLNADFSAASQTNYCAPATLSFTDQSRSFGSIEQWYWDFGDGSLSTLQNPPPHEYAVPGNYSVVTTILGNNGCWSDSFKQVITIGSIPEPDFDIPATICEAKPVTVTDRSTVTYGTISQWNWTIDGQSFSDQQPPEIPAVVGTFNSLLQVTTAQGCISAQAQKQTTVLPAPVLTLSEGAEICAGQTISLSTVSQNPASEVTSWNWNPTAANNSSYNFTGAAGGDFTISVIGTAANGCSSEPVSTVISVVRTDAYAGRDTVIADNQSLQLNGSGGPILEWSPAQGLDNPLSATPVASIAQETSYVLTASTESGCSSKDTINIRVYKGPEIYVPNSFSPNSDQRNDRFRYIAVGMRKMHYFQIYNRLGQMVYEGFDNSGWDGKFRGKEQGSGVFSWQLSGEDTNGKVYRKKGSVLLLR